MRRKREPRKVRVRVPAFTAGEATWAPARVTIIRRPSGSKRAGFVRLTADQVTRIRWERAFYGNSQRALAQRYAVGKSTINDMLTGKTWAWL